jgi:ferredoxin-like protein FixX
VTCAVESFQPTTTTFKSPALCAAVYGIATVVALGCGAAKLLCTKAMEEAWAYPEVPANSRRRLSANHWASRT